MKPKTYIRFNRALCEWVKKTPPEISAEDVKTFIADLNGNRHSPASSMNLAISAIQFFYQRVLGRDIVHTRYRPVQDKRLPAVFAKTEITKCRKDRYVMLPETAAIAPRDYLSKRQSETRLFSGQPSARHRPERCWGAEHIRNLLKRTR